MCFQLAERGGSHGAGCADLGLTAAFRAGDRAVPLDQRADQTGHGQRAADLLVGVIIALLHIQQDGRQHAARAAGRCSDDGAVVGILLGNGEGIGADHAQLAHLRNFVRTLLLEEQLRLRTTFRPPGRMPSACRPISTERFMARQISARKSQISGLRSARRIRSGKYSAICRTGGSRRRNFSG